MSDVTKAMSSESADKEELKELLWTDFKIRSLIISKAPDQGQRSGPEVRGRKEDEEESILSKKKRNPNCLAP